MALKGGVIFDVRHLWKSGRLGYGKVWNSGMEAGVVHTMGGETQGVRSPDMMGRKRTVGDQHPHLKDEARKRSRQKAGESQEMWCHQG